MPISKPATNLKNKVALVTGASRGIGKGTAIALAKEGATAGYNASRIASNHMIKQGSGLIVNFSFWASQQNDKGVAYGVAKAATDRMTQIMAHELLKHHIAVVCLYPGIVRTEAVLKAADHFDLSNSESTEFMGRIISKLTTDPELMKKSGKIFIGARLAMEYGVLDTDGRQPRPLGIDEV